MRENEELYRNIFETNQAVKLLINIETGDIVDSNQAACDFYGYSREELRSKRIDDINILPLEEIQAEMISAINENRLYFNFSHRLASGEVRERRVFTSPVNVKGRSLLFSIIHDITNASGQERPARERGDSQGASGRSHGLRFRGTGTERFSMLTKQERGGLIRNTLT